MADEKAALVELYNGAPQAGTHLSDDEPTTSMMTSSDNEGYEPPSYQEALGDPSSRPSNDIRTPPPRPPPPTTNRQTQLPLIPPAQTQQPTTVMQLPVNVMTHAPVTSQPTFVAVPTVAVNQGPVMHQPTILCHHNVSPHFSGHIRPFSSGLFNCGVDCLSCCCGTFCTCCYLGALASKLEESCLTGVCCMVGLAPLRTKLRERHDIYGSVCDDVCMSACCGCCVVCQMGRELQALQYETKCCCC